MLAPPKLKVNEEKVIVKGLVKQNQLSLLYSEASIFVMPTIREPFGLAFLEAMAFKLPCIGTDIEAVPEIIEDGKTGFIVPVSSPRILAEKFCFLLENDDLMHEMGEAGFKKIKESFLWEKVADKMIDGFKEVLML